MPFINECHDMPLSVERVSPRIPALKKVFSSTVTVGNILRVTEFINEFMLNVSESKSKPRSVHVFPASVERKLVINPNAKSVSPAAKI